MKKESSHVLTSDDLKRGINLLKDNSDRDEIERNERSLKDWTKLSTFRQELEKSDLPFMEKIELGKTITMLAQGYYLVMGEYQHKIITDELREKWKIPEEVLKNIYMSPNLSTQQ